MRWIRDGYATYHAVADRPLCTMSYDAMREEAELPVGAFACSMCVRALVADYRPAQKVDSIEVPSRRGANWADPGTGEDCFFGWEASPEWCSLCTRHISRHFGRTEYRCKER